MRGKSTLHFKRFPKEYFERKGLWKNWTPTEAEIKGVKALDLKKILKKASLGKRPYIKAARRLGAADQIIKKKRNVVMTKKAKLRLKNKLAKRAKEPRSALKLAMIKKLRKYVDVKKINPKARTGLGRPDKSVCGRQLDDIV